jgi:uncharacterized protein (TIGR02444 family)
MDMAGQDASAESFWRYSLMIYAQPGVAEALIGLQDRAGHNVNLILFGLWLGYCEATTLDIAGLARARAAIAGIDRDVVVPLRQLRRALKDHPDSDMRELRPRVLALELVAERRAQARLAGTIVRRQSQSVDDRHAAAAINLRLILGVDFDSAETALVLHSAAD